MRIIQRANEVVIDNISNTSNGFDAELKKLIVQNTFSPDIKLIFQGMHRNHQILACDLTSDSAIGNLKNYLGIN